MFTKMLFPTANFHFLADSPVSVGVANTGHVEVTRSNDCPWFALSLVLCAHLTAFAALSQQPQSLPLETLAKPIMVSLVSAQQTTLPKTLPPVKPVAKVQKPVNKQVKTPISKSVTPLIKQAAAQSIVPVEQISVPVAEPSSATVEQEAQATNKKTADTQTYQAPEFNAAYLNNPPPVYPPVSRQLGEQGLVLLRVQVTEHGLATAVELQTGSGSTRLDQAALAAVKKWRFIPAKRGEQPVFATVIVPVGFSIDEG